MGWLWWFWKWVYLQALVSSSGWLVTQWGNLTYDLTGKAGSKWYYVSSCLHFPAIVTPYMSFTSWRSASRGLNTIRHDRSVRSKLFLRISAHAIQRNYFLLNAGRGKICLFTEEKRIHAALLFKSLNIRFWRK